MNDIFQSGEIDNRPEQWKNIGIINLNYNKKNYYYRSLDQPSKGGYIYNLYSTSSGFYTTHKPLSLQKPITTKIDSVFTQNYATKQYEPIDVS